MHDAGEHDVLWHDRRRRSCEPSNVPQDRDTPKSDADTDEAGACSGRAVMP
jgi:hypothetical protein